MQYPERSQDINLKNPKTPSNLSGEIFGTLVNLSGRRRFTSQRVVLFAVLAAQGRDRARQMADDALTAFRDAHSALVHGTDRVPGIFCDELQEAYFGASQGDKVIRDFIGLAGRALDAIEACSPGAPSLLEQLVESATPLLAVLNGITQVYDDLAKRQASLAKKQLTGIMSDIESIAKQAHIVGFNAQIVAARAGASGREFSVVASELSRITGKIDELVREALRASAA
ncbi:MAG TPA: methyl-accepting chemotaxis protein [Burkholderiaceae bacterium]|nr:methyl-accepting chemotaxis protein [Burkholderiaceae bacterium]